DPAGALTLSGPVVAPAGTVAWITVAEASAEVGHNVSNITAVSPVQFLSLIFTLVPTDPLVGAKLVIVGGGTTVNAALLVAEPAGVVTLSGPVVAPTGTVAWIAVAEVTVKLALTPLKATAVAPVKLVPLMLTLF